MSVQSGKILQGRELTQRSSMVHEVDADIHSDEVSIQQLEHVHRREMRYRKQLRYIQFNSGSHTTLVGRARTVRAFGYLMISLPSLG